MPQYLNLNVNGDWIRGKYGYESLYNWALNLVQLARNQAVSTPATGSISFSANPLALTENADGTFFTGTVTVSKTINGNYGLSNNLPEGSAISGYSGGNGDVLTIQIPTAHQQQSYTLTAYGSHSSNTAKLFFWQPDAWNQQRVVTCVIGWDSSYVETSMTITTPAATPKNGSIQLTKLSEDGNPLPGVSFTLYDASQNFISSGTTDGSGVITFVDLPLGSYYYAETATLPGYVLDSTLYPVSITEGGQLVTVTATNTLARGNVSVLKVDENGTPLAGVHVVTEGDTGADGKLSFTGLLLGSYVLQETATVEGYVLDSEEIPVTVSENGQTVEITRQNIPIRGNLEIIKKDAYEETYLMGAGFRLYDGEGTQIAEGYTDAFGKITFPDLLYGSYSYQEFKAPKGYELDDTIYPFSITEHGVTITETRDNLRRPGTLIVKKQNAGGSPLAGAAFLLEFSTDDAHS